MNDKEQKLVKWLFLVFTLKQLVWVAFIPPWQFPDEQAHFAQVQNVAERSSISAFPGPNTSREIVETEKLLGTFRDGFGNNKFTYHPEFKLPLTDTVSHDSETAIRNFPTSYRNERVIYEATVYPPLYYILASLGYRVVYGEDLLTRIFTVRLINIPIFLMTLHFVNKIGRLLFGKHQSLTVLLLFFVGFHPMFSFVAAGTTSDNLYHLLSTAVIYLSLKLLLEGFSFKWVLGTAITSLFLWWTKPQGKLMYLVTAGSIIYSLFLNKNRSQRRPLLMMLTVILIATFGYVLLQLAAGAQFLPDIPGWDVVREGNLSVISHLKWTLNHTYREVLPWYWGVFRWLSLTYPRPIHRFLNWLVLVSIAGLAFSLLHRRIKLAMPISTVWFLVIANLIYFFGLFIYDYLFTLTHHFSFGIQGRYYFPLLASQMALLVIGLYYLSRFIPHGHLLLKGVGITMLFLHLFAQVFVILSYLTPHSAIAFFQQASQYRPFFFKTPFLEFLTGFYLLSLVILLWYYVRDWRGKGIIYEESSR